MNLGTANGIAPGNLFVVYKIMYPSVPTPRNVIGELVVVAVRERTSTARVLYSRDADHERGQGRASVAANGRRRLSPYGTQAGGFTSKT